MSLANPVIAVIGAGAVGGFYGARLIQHGFNVHTIGIILMLVGVVGAVLSIIGLVSTNFRRHRTVIDDGRGNVVQRDDTYT